MIALFWDIGVAGLEDRFQDFYWHLQKLNGKKNGTWIYKAGTIRIS